MSVVEKAAGLPILQPQQPAENRMQFASRVLQFLLATECTAVCSDDDLKDAKYAALFAVAAKEISPIAVDRISAIVHLADAMLRFRAIDRDGVLQSLQALGSVASVPAGRDKPNAGPMAPLTPQPILNPITPTAAVMPAVARQKVEINF